jgi:hypothetical protein
MSEVISFRLNKDNLREAKALLILKEWRTKGYSLRQIITEALIKFDEAGKGLDINAIENLKEALSQANHLLSQIENSDPFTSSEIRDFVGNSALSKSFLASVKKSAKTGMHIE